MTNICSWLCLATGLTMKAMKVFKVIDRSWVFLVKKSIMHVHRYAGYCPHRTIHLLENGHLLLYLWYSIVYLWYRAAVLTLSKLCLKVRKVSRIHWSQFESSAGPMQVLGPRQTSPLTLSKFPTSRVRFPHSLCPSRAGKAHFDAGGEVSSRQRAWWVRQCYLTCSRSK